MRIGVLRYFSFVLLFRKCGVFCRLRGELFFLGFDLVIMEV